MAVVRDMKHHPDTEFAAAAAAAAATATAAATTGHSGAGGGGGGNSTDDPERFRIKSDATEPTGPSRNSGSKVGGRGGRVSGSSAAGASDAGGGGGSGKTPNSFVHVSIFPGENFCFSWQCNVLVLAEDKEKAQFHLGQLQAKVRRGEHGRLLSANTLSIVLITRECEWRRFSAPLCWNPFRVASRVCRRP